MRSSPFVALASVLAAAVVTAQGPPANGPRQVDPGFYALVGADVVTAPGQRLANATVVIKDGRFVAVGADATPPAGATVWDGKGLTLYPGLIECCLPVDAPAPDGRGPEQHWNMNVLPQRSALEGPGASTDDRSGLRALGFCAAAIAPTGGVFKGSSAVVLLDEPADGERTQVLAERSYQLLSFRGSAPGYPGSEMGAIALIRQTLRDADWYERCLATVASHRELAAPTPAAALQALVVQRALPLCFDVDDELEVMRAAKIARELQRPAFVLGSGFEFRRLAAVAACKLPLVVPLHYPQVPEVSTMAQQAQVTLRQLWSWEQAPTNSTRLPDAGVELGWTTARLADRQAFRQNAAAAIACGVTPEQALAALTTVPARLLGVGDQLGSIAKGKVANLVAVRGLLFDPKAAIAAVWVGGRRFAIEAERDRGLDGRWTATLPNGKTGELTIDGDKVAFALGDDKIAGSNVQREPQRVDFALQDKRLDSDGVMALHARADGDELVGDGRRGNGRDFTWSATRAGELPARTTPKEPPQPPPMLALPTPMSAYGLRETSPTQTVVFTGATLWTAGPNGNIEPGALYVADGKIVFAGRVEDLPQLPAHAVVIDATGKHITPGLIDCHSHTGISRGINEGTQAVTAEVRVQDVINPDDVNWYRELAGGVTTVNQLHGSANPIGGQNSVVKLRWGCADADAMRFLGAPAGIKFALGENPRRANGGDDSNDRYPNTRMGVAALIRDRFVAAREYGAARDAYEALAPKARAAVLPVRQDLELDAVAEILAGQRRVHCHSYRQDEILMLCDLAQEFGFRIGTFQHVLEGYKVAEAIARSAIGASAFSDWWAYKLEVYDAIPENGALMHEHGVVVSFNSDSNELARRLNTEAGKAVKYGGVPPATAIRFVTLNAAIQLGIDARTGSLEKGKDADFVIWSGDPLGYTSRCEATYVDGRPLFTIERDRELRVEAARERQRLLQQALLAGPGKPDRAERSRDSFADAEDHTEPYCCRTAEGGGR